MSLSWQCRAIWPASTYTDSTALLARYLRLPPGTGAKKCSSRKLKSVGQAVFSVTSWKTRGQRLKKVGKWVRSSSPAWCRALVQDVGRTHGAICPPCGYSV
ncbi:hypothetical protein NQZ68_022496 [Dissostichus eleginoides]|nr:hypothetical protein NQZ68_022496 [Dissostichus eleginoides]